MIRIRLVTVLLAAITASLAPAQDWDKREEKLAKSATARLLAFARTAERNKVLSRAKEAYELILEQYDPEHAKAHRTLGHKKEGGVWKVPEVQEEWPDRATDEQRFRVIDEWKRIAESIGGLHRDLGLEMKEKEPVRGLGHLEMALYFDPFDYQAHEGVGHKQFDDFWGTDADIAFVKRMREIERFAAELAKKDFPVEPVEGLPKALQVMVDADPEIEFHGAKSDTFTIFTRGTQENADTCVQWAERACDFLEFVLPPDVPKKWDVRKKIKATWAWNGYIWTRAEQKALIELNPELNLNDDFVNSSWGEDGRIASVIRSLTPSSMHDNLVARVFRQIEGNDGTVEGYMHAATWYMRATAITRFGAHKTGTTTGEKTTLPDSANWWMRRIRDQAIARTDFPANNIPRVQLSDFRNDARVKTWSFGLWMMARYPEKWFHFLQALPESEERPWPNVIDDLYLKIFERSREDIEEEWRGWAAGRTLASYATGYGPPLLPEAPSKDQLRALERLNEFRAILDLPPCEIDLEATLACRDHALFLQQNTDHWKWPEAHEEDPAKPGFSTRGMRAGLQSVIILSPDGTIDAPDSLDGWMGTPYHRFPLLEPNIRRIGFALEENVAVLDMGSLEEPRDPEFEEKFRWVQWPADGVEGIPTSFHATEEPDPLADTPEGKRAEPFELQRSAGYPISLQLARYVVMQVEDASMELWTAKKRGKEFERDERVPCWVHTPKVPLLKRQENASVVFAIPKEKLEKGSYYEVEVMLRTRLGEEKIVWHFKTGSQRRGHGRLKIKKDD